MKEQKYKRIAVIDANSAEVFEARMNELLLSIVNPEIVMDRNRPFLAYVFYDISKNFPECALELLEMLDPEGGQAVCGDCPHFMKSDDKRMKRGLCASSHERVRIDLRACERYYIERRRENAQLVKEFQQIPFTNDDKKNTLSRAKFCRTTRLRAAKRDQLASILYYGSRGFVKGQEE